MPPRKSKVKLGAVTNWKDANVALRDIRARRQRIARIEARANERRSKADEQLTAQTADDLALIRKLEDDMEAFATAHLPEFNPSRSRKLQHGVLAFRLVKRLQPLPNWTWADVLEQLKAPVLVRLEKLLEKLLGRYIRVKLSINKQGIIEAYSAGTLDDEGLAALGLRMVPRDKFDYELADTDAKSTA